MSRPFLAANFIVLGLLPPSTATHPTPTGGRTHRDGKPARTYRFQQYTVLVYDYNVLRQLRRFHYP